MGMNQKMPGAHRIGAAISGSRIAGRNFMDVTFIKVARLESKFCHEIFF